MCNDFGNHIPYSAYVEAFSELKIPLLTPGGAPNLQPRDDIWPTETAPVLRRAEGDGVELAQLRWGLDPGRPKAPPVINFRSEGRHFAKGRCLVPAVAQQVPPARRQRGVQIEARDAPARAHPRLRAHLIKRDQDRRPVILLGQPPGGIGDHEGHHASDGQAQSDLRGGESDQLGEEDRRAGHEGARRRSEEQGLQCQPPAQRSRRNQPPEKATQIHRMIRSLGGGARHLLFTRVSGEIE